MSQKEINFLFLHLEPATEYDPASLCNHRTQVGLEFGKSA